jgi:type I restriction enzyme S subunit
MKPQKFKKTEIGKIPEDWEVKTIKEITEAIFSGGTPNTTTPEYWDGDIRWLSSGETRQTFIRDTERKITELGIENSSTRLAKKEDVVVAGAGQGYTRGQPSFCMIDTYVNQSVVVLTSNKKILVPLFLFYNLKSRYDELRQLSDAHSSRGSLTTKLLANFPIKLPKLDEQKIISKILSDLDFKIELNQKMNKTLEAIGQALFKRWFVDFEFPDENGNPYKSSGGEMVESELGKIPKGWSVSTIGKELKTVLGGTPSREKKEYWTDGNIAWINSGEINKFPIVNASECITSDAVKNSATQVMPSRTVVLPFVISVGKEINISLLGIETCGNQSVLGIIENANIPSEFIYYWINFMKEDIYSWATGGAQQHINKFNVDQTKILIPLDNIMKEYSVILNPIFKLIIKNALEIENLSSIRDSLLPKLMSGEIRVKIGGKDV